MEHGDRAESVTAAVGLLAKGVFLLSLRDQAGRAVTPGTALINFSEAPPSLLFSMGGAGSLAPRLHPGAEVALNLLAEDQAPLLQHCARERGDARFGMGEWCDQPPAAPWLRGCRAVLAGRVQLVWEYAGQLAVVVVVERAQAASERPPLLYSDGRMGGWHALEPPDS